MKDRKPPGVSWKIRILIEHENFAYRSNDFAPLVKVDGVWRVLEDYEQEWYY